MYAMTDLCRPSLRELGVGVESRLANSSAFLVWQVHTSCYYKTLR